MNKVFLSTIITTSLLVFAANLFSQTNKSIELGVGAGLFIYQGDLTSKKIGSFKTAKPGVNIWIQKNLTNQLALKLNVAAATLQGDDSKYATDQEYRLYRNYFFNTNIKEVSISSVFNLNSNKIFNPYIAAGVGYNFIQPKNSWTNTNFNFFTGENLENRIKQDSLKNSASNNMLVLPFGAGTKVKISNQLHANLDFTYRLCFTDYIDGVSIAANDRKNDYFYSINASLSYSFNSKRNQNITEKLPELPTKPQSAEDNKAIINPKADSDSDGIYDANDACPTTFGYAKYNGCPISDKDLDGVTDDYDECPDVKGAVENKGCPKENTKKNEGPSDEDNDMASLSANDSIKLIIYFDWNRSDLNTGPTFSTLRQVADMMQKNTNYQIILRGHTDNIGSQQSNLALSQLRTNVCSAYLQSYNIGASRIKEEAYGKLSPVVNTNDERQQWKNRRVELVIYNAK